MTKIKCNYVQNPYDALHKKTAAPVYCVHRTSEGECGLEEIEVGECDSGWQATCDEMRVKESEAWWNY